MPEYPLPNPALPFGQQAVSPVAQTNPLMSLQQGGVQGFSLGLQARQQAMLQQEQQRLQQKQEQEQELARKKQLNEQAERGLEHLTDPKYSKFLPTKTKVGIFKQSVIPYLNETYGFNIDPDSIPDTETISEEEQNFLNLVKNKADKSVIAASYAEMVSKAPEERLPIVREMGAASGIGSASRSSNFTRPVSRVSERGNPVLYTAEGYMEVDPELGTIPLVGKLISPSTNPSTGAETALRDVLQQRSLLTESLSNLTPDKVGLINKKWKDVGTYMDQSTDPEATYFRSLTELANTMIRYKYYGATLTNNEQRAFGQIAANRNLSPQAFMSQVKALEFAMDKVEKAIKDASAQSNRPFVNQGPRKPASPAPVEDLSKMSDEDLQRIIRGEK